jgi:hypothetical protein
MIAKTEIGRITDAKSKLEYVKLKSPFTDKKGIYILLVGSFFTSAKTLCAKSTISN